MTIPDYQSIMLPLLNLLSNKDEISLSDIINRLATFYNLTAEQRKALLPSGNQSIFDNRVGWACTYMKKAGLLENSRRGYLRITERGLDVLKTSPKEINDKFLWQFPEFIQFKNRNEKNVDTVNSKNQRVKLVKYRDYSRKEVHDIFDPTSEYSPSSGRWGLRGIVNIPNSNDYVFFVTFGRSWAGHTFKEVVTVKGILSWQSQPSNKLSNPMIKKFINHDHIKNNIYLFLRTNSDKSYTYLGKLAYVSHDKTKEKPVYFKWQILDWELCSKRAKSIGLTLEPAYDNCQDSYILPLIESSIIPEICLMPEKEKRYQKDRNMRSSIVAETKNSFDIAFNFLMETINSIVNDNKSTVTELLLHGKYDSAQKTVELLRQIDEIKIKLQEVESDWKRIYRSEFL